MPEEILTVAVFGGAAVIGMANSSRDLIGIWAEGDVQEMRREMWP